MNTNQRSILLPCPFCGGEPVKSRASGDERDGYANCVSYTCKGCGCTRSAKGISGKGYADNTTVEERAFNAWNTREGVSPELALLSEARELLKGIEGCPWVVEPATVPKAGVDSAPSQVVGTMHVGLLRLRKIRTWLSKAGSQ